jgi:hypothetical protein
VGPSASLDLLPHEIEPLFMLLLLLYMLTGLDCVSELRPPTGLLFIPQMVCVCVRVRVEGHGGMISRQGKTPDSFTRALWQLLPVESSISHPHIRVKHCAYGHSVATLLNPLGGKTVSHEYSLTVARYATVVVAVPSTVRYPANYRIKIYHHHHHLPFQY